MSKRNPYRRKADGMIVCREHPRYRKLKAPTGSCAACLYLWFIVAAVGR